MSDSAVVEDSSGSLGLELSLLAGNWSSDDSRPDTPHMGSTDVLSFSDNILVDTLLKSVERGSEWETLVHPHSPISPKAGSPSTVMWNMDSAPLDPPIKPLPQPAPPHITQLTPSEIFKSSGVTVEFELFALEGISSDDDSSSSGSKRKANSLENADSKKAKVRQALTAEALKLIAADTPESKRMTHNVLERKRRNDLKASYQDLREMIPELASQERAPTAQILQKAVEYIESLKHTEQQLASGLAALRAENERLQALCGRA